MTLEHEAVQRYCSDCRSYGNEQVDGFNCINKSSKAPEDFKDLVRKAAANQGTCPTFAVCVTCPKTDDSALVTAQTKLKCAVCTNQPDHPLDTRNCTQFGDAQIITQAAKNRCRKFNN